MKTILLVGKQNTGKTTTFNLLYDELLKKNAQIIGPKSSVGGCVDDFECVLKYKNKEVALFSMGDYLNECTEAIIKYCNRDVLIMAYSDKFSANWGAIFKKYNHHKVIQKTQNNSSDVNSIISLF